MSQERIPADGAPRELRARALSLGIFIASVLLALLFYLFYLQVIQGLEYKLRARAAVSREVPLPAQRGEIFDRSYNLPLVVNQDSFAVDLSPAEVSPGKLEELFGRLAAVLSAPVEEIRKRIPPKYYNLYQPIEIKAGVDFATIALLAEHLEQYPGLSWHNKPIRNYLETGTIAHVIGYVGDINREELQILYNQGYQFGAVLGKTGLEKQYDKLLRGNDGKRFHTVDVTEKYLEQQEEEDIPPQPGKNLVLTIDRNIQELCEKALGKRIGSVVVLKPGNGEVLALVSYPTYDPNLFFTGRATEEFKTLSLDPSFPFINRAIQSAYPPASAFKMVMSTALVEEQPFPLTSKVVCTGQIEYGDRIFRCHLRKSGHGPMDFFSGLAQSCDVYFYKVGDELGVERITQYAREFGLGEQTGIDLPGEVPGFVPSPEWKLKTQHMKWLGGDTLNLSIGQGFLTVTPLQMADIAAMIANEGKIYRPHLLKEVRDPATGAVLSSMEPELIHISHVQKETFRTVQKAMRGVITEGTAKVVITTKAVEVAGKTGTGEVGLENRWHSWFAAYAPYDPADARERVVVMVMVEAENEWEWWAPKAADVILQGIFAGQSFEEAVHTLKPWWYLEELRKQKEAEAGRP